jgi:hypothetical protein
LKLNPTLAPGRSNRKARAFSVEIAQLAQDGYGCKAIHEALAAAGLIVSKSTVQRELTRLSKPPTLHGQRSVVPPAATRRPIDSLQVALPDGLLPTEEQPNGKDIAEAFLKGRITNPLLRKRI